MVQTLKYTEIQEDELKDNYTSYDPDDHDGREDYILKFMAKHDKSKRSVISKLSKMDIYITRPKVSKVTGGEPETKKTMVSDIALKLGANPEQFEGMDKTPKLVLKLLRELLTERL